MTARAGSLRAGAVTSVRSLAMLSLVAVAGSAGLAAWLALPCAAEGHDERAVRAAYVFNLTKYVEWPETSHELVVGFIGDGPMGDILLKMLDGKLSEGRRIRVVVNPADQDLEQCNILYLGGRTNPKAHAVLDRIRDRPVLTVGESEDFLRDNGMLGLVRVGEQIQIEVNLQLAQQGHLKISSRLLNVAKIVKSGAEVPN